MTVAPRVYMFDAHSHLYSGAQRTLVELAVGGRGFTPIVAGPNDGPMLAAARSAGLEVSVITPPAAISGYRGQLLRAAAELGSLRSSGCCDTTSPPLACFAGPEPTSCIAPARGRCSRLGLERGSPVAR